MTHTRLLIVLLRLAGAFTSTAFLAMVMPAAWMAAVHGWLGLGEFPRAPIVDYLTRSLAALYGFHGVLLLLVSRDPARHRSIVWYIASMNVLLGAVLLAIDAHAGMPLFWTLGEGIPIVAFGVALGVLNRSVPAPQDGQDARVKPRATPSAKRP